MWGKTIVQSQDPLGLKDHVQKERLRFKRFKIKLNKPSVLFLLAFGFRKFWNVFRRTTIRVVNAFHELYRFLNKINFFAKRRNISELWNGLFLVYYTIYAF